MDRPLPIPCAHDKEFWEAVSQDRLVVQKTAAGHWQSYPRAHALDDPMTRDTAPRFEPVAGTGTIETFSVVHRSFYPAIQAPYVFAVVRLDEGVCMTAHIVDAEPSEVGIGDPVRATFVEIAPGQKLPCFKLNKAGSVA
ncbi:OB-fold domain-containing protein [Mesorhizobium sp. M1312]|uniref:Zn-ribbon domain-containing OB-fold protein n=1 Tax=unclassified Mesorhizobium TaxID=325217 RepID=UPI003339103B